MAITSIGSGSAAVLLSSGGTAQQQITSVVVPRVPGGVPAGQASRLVQLADVNAVSLPGGVLTEIVGPGGERRFEIRDDLRDRVDAIYGAGITPSLKNATYTNGILHWTGGKITLPFGDVSAAVATVPSSTPLSITLPVGTLSSGQFLLALWHPSADPAVALSQSQVGQQGLSVSLLSNGSDVKVDNNSVGGLADSIPVQIVLEGKHLKVSVPDYPNANYTTPDTVYDTPLYLHVYAISDNQSPVPDVSFEFVGAAATGLLPDEIAARIAADAALQEQIADLLTALALRVRVDAVQSLTLAQQLQARQNINAEAVGVAAGLVAAITPASIGAATAVQGAKADTALQSADVAPVALSGQYSALTGLPTIPGLSSSTPAAPTTSGTAGTANTAARGDHAHPLPTAAQITAAVLTGLASGSATAIAAADTILQALEKLQAQASANAGLLAPVPRKIGPSWFVSGRWYDPCHPFFLTTTLAAVPAGAVQFVPMCPAGTLTAQQIGIYISTASAAGSKIRLGIYADSAGTPGVRLYDSEDIASDSTGPKIAACTQAFTAGVQYWLALYSEASVGVGALVGSAMGQENLAWSSTAYAMSGQSGLPTSATGAVFTSIHNPRIMLQAG